MRIVTWNAEVGRGGKAFTSGITDIIRNHDPDVIVLQEAEGYVDDMRKIAGYRTYARKGWPEAGMNPVMVKRTHPKLRRITRGWGVIRNHTGWIGPKHHLHHPGRTWTWVKVGGVHIVSLHRVWGGTTPQNRDAYLEEAATLIQWLNRHDTVVIFGDHNTRVNEDYPGASARVARSTGSTLLYDPDEPGIDYALTRQMLGHVRRVHSYGSDHRAAVYRSTS